MNATQRLMTCAAGAGLLALLLAAAPAPPKISGGVSVDGDDEPEKKNTATRETLKVGDKAPNFTLTGSDGKTYKLSDYKGRTVVLEWANPDCPIWRRLYETEVIPAAYETLKERDEEIVWLAINSTNYTDAEQNNKWIEDHELEYPILLDASGTVGKKYDARTSPHMYVIDGEGVLRYMGAIDDDPSGRKMKRDEETTNYVTTAVKQLQADETVSPDTTKPYGCAVKYKK